MSAGVGAVMGLVFSGVKSAWDMASLRVQYYFFSTYASAEKSNDRTNLDMAIRDLFRSKREPEWKSSDVNARLNAVRQLGSDEHDLLRSLAQEDPAPAVRRAALRKIQDFAVLGELLAAEKDE